MAAGLMAVVVAFMVVAPVASTVEEDSTAEEVSPAAATEVVDIMAGIAAVDQQGCTAAALE